MDYSARWYSPNYGRFITEDTFLGWMEEPLSLNRYSYVSNNPVNYIDPTGGWSDYPGDTEEEEEEIYYVRDVNLYVNGLFEEMVDLMSDNHTYFKGTDTRVREYYESRGYIVEWEEEKGVLAWSSIEERNRNLANEAGDMPDDEGISEYSYQYVQLYDPAYEEQIENELRQEYSNSSSLGKGLVIAKMAGHVWAKKYRYAKANMQVDLYEELRIDPDMSGEIIDVSALYVTGEAVVGTIAKGAKTVKPFFKGTGELKFSSTKSATKWANQIKNRGWTEKQISSTINKPYTTRASLNRATGNSATVYYTKEGSYVVVDDVTKEIVQISDNINPSSWTPDPDIIDPYLP